MTSQFGVVGFVPVPAGGRKHVRRRSMLVGALAVATAVALLVPMTASASTPHFTYTLDTIGPQNGGGEPSVVFGQRTLYVSAPGAGMMFYRSADTGKTWVAGGLADTSSGDTSVNTDQSGAVYQSNLNAITGDTNTLQVDVYKSFDKGDTWPQKGTSTIEDNSSQQPFFVDRQWTDALIPAGGTTDTATVYVSYHDWAPSEVWVNKSTDGGKTFGTAVPVINDPVAVADSYCNTIPGGLKIVRSGPHAGRVYVAWLAGDPTNSLTGCNETQLQAFHDIWIAYSDDGGTTWTDKLVYDAGPLHDGSEIFADLTLDNQGNPYLGFTMNIEDEFDVYVEASFDGGQTWNAALGGAPYKMNTDTGTHYFPAIIAGKPGNVDMAWLGTTTIVPTTPYGKPEPNGDVDADWNLFAGTARGLNTATPKSFAQQLTTTPMHHGDICTLGIFCLAVDGNRDLLDFIDITTDSSGLFHVSYTDDYSAGALVAANQTGGPTIGAGGH
jgi:hypothetical protein